MKTHIHRAQTLLAFGFLAALALVAPPATALEAPERALIRAVVQATESPENPVDAEVRRLSDGIDAIVARLGEGRPTLRRARRLHQLLHDDHLRVYDRDADTLAQIMDEGAFNCLSASLLYGTIARSLGYRVEAYSVPGHLLIRLFVGDRVVDVETTLPFGFDARRDGPHDGPRVSPDREASVGRAADTGATAAHGVGMPLEAAVGFAWLNRSWHDLELGLPLAAAVGVERALALLPPATDQVDGARMLLARAFSVEYDAGHFDAAFRIAAIDAGLFPDKTTSRDRLIAAALKQIEDHCDGDRPRQALSVVDAVGRAFPAAAEFARLERRAYPGIAAAAVRRAEWALAGEVGDRYAVAQTDAYESARLAEWIERRRHPERQAAPSAGDTPPVILY